MVMMSRPSEADLGALDLFWWSWALDIWCSNIVIKCLRHCFELRFVVAVHGMKVNIINFDKLRQVIQAMNI